MKTAKITITDKSYIVKVKQLMEFLIIIVKLILSSIFA